MTTGMPGSAALAGGEQQQQQQAPADNANNEGGTPWYSALPADTHGYVQTKGWSDPAAMLASYRNLEGLNNLPAEARADQILVMPKGDKPEEVAAFMDKVTPLLGIPKTAEEYGFKAPEGMELPILDNAAKWALEAGMPKAAAEKFVGAAMAYEVEQGQAFEAQSQKDIAALQTELGDKFDNTMELGRRAVRAAGLDAGTLQKIEVAIGTGPMLRMFNKYGASLTEAEAPSGGDQQQQGDQFRVTPAAAKDKIAALQKDDAFMARYLSPNPGVRKLAIEEMEKLQMAAAGTA